MNLRVKDVNATFHNVALTSLNISVDDLKAELAKLFPIEPKNQRLVFKGKIL